MIQRIYHIIKRELTIEYRDSHSFLASLLYLIGITYVVYKVFGDLDSPAKVGLVLILLLYTVINIVGNSFSFQGQDRKVYHYTLYKPLEMLTAKFFFNLLKVVIALCILVGLVVILSNSPLKDAGLYFLTLILCATGLTAILTLVSSISSYTNNQGTLVHVMSIPLMIPILLISMRLSLIAERFIVDSATDNYLMMLIGVDVIFVALLYVFIPYTWKS